MELKKTRSFFPFYILYDYCDYFLFGILRPMIFVGYSTMEHQQQQKQQLIGFHLRTYNRKVCRKEVKQVDELKCLNCTKRTVLRSHVAVLL